eukprot:GHUV01005916.1.p2 GENE.GHUV01005916.1~~GHUV01005916.1.p2  ORF type:complete len:107 (-),score=37.27 GHUV01005916.1:760-1080(-)
MLSLRPFAAVAAAAVAAGGSCGPYYSYQPHHCSTNLQRAAATAAVSAGRQLPRQQSYQLHSCNTAPNSQSMAVDLAGVAVQRRLAAACEWPSQLPTPSCNMPPVLN